MLDLFSTVFFGFLALLIVTAAIAPFESLGWWAGWFGEQGAPPVPGQAPHVPEAVAESPHEHFIVYLSGVGAMDGTAIPQEEIDWGSLAVKRIPQTTFVHDVYPYSVTNAGLLAERSLSPLWRYLERRRRKNSFDLLQWLINIRNMIQVAISADRRYGPIYNLGVANEIVQALQLCGYRVGGGKQVTLVGTSGGGQIAVGAAPYLRSLLGVPVRIISLGGVISDDPGIASVRRLYHLYGTTDPVHGLGRLLYLGRWPIVPHSDWNRAVAAGRVQFVNMGSMAHNGSRNYFSWSAFTPAGQPHAVACIDTISALLVREGLIDAEAVSAAQAATEAEAKALAEAQVAAQAAANEERRERKSTV